MRVSLPVGTGGVHGRPGPRRRLPAARPAFEASPPTPPALPTDTCGRTRLDWVHDGVLCRAVDGSHGRAGDVRAVALLIVGVRAAGRVDAIAWEAVRVLGSGGGSGSGEDGGIGEQEETQNEEKGKQVELVRSRPAPGHMLRGKTRAAESRGDPPATSHAPTRPVKSSCVERMPVSST